MNESSKEYKKKIIITLITLIATVYIPYFVNLFNSSFPLPCSTSFYPVGLIPSIFFRFFIYIPMFAYMILILIWVIWVSFVWIPFVFNLKKRFFKNE